MDAETRTRHPPLPGQRRGRRPVLLLAAAALLLGLGLSVAVAGIAVLSDRLPLQRVTTAARAVLEGEVPLERAAGRIVAAVETRLPSLGLRSAPVAVLPVRAPLAPVAAEGRAIFAGEDSIEAALRALAVFPLPFATPAGPTAPVAAAPQPGPAPAPARAALPPPPPRALAIACPPRTPGARVEVAVSDPAPRLSHDTPVAGLNALAGHGVGSGFQHLGLTILRSEWRSEIALRVAGGDGAVCAVVEHVRVTLAHTENRILIAREIPAGTCLYQEVEAHERRHVAANTRVLRAAVAPARRAIEAWAAEAEGRAANPETAKAVLQEGLRQAMEPVMAALNERRTEANRAVDSPEEYQRLSRSCALDHVRLQDRLRRP